MRSKEIGGYFGFEELIGEEYYKDLYRFNLGRTALKALIRAREIKRLYLPIWLCDSVIKACKDEGIELSFYRINENLEINLDISLGNNEYLYLVNYYGVLTKEKQRKLKTRYGNIIVDNTQGFFEEPIDGIDTIYSIRKYFGVSDGAYLSSDISIPKYEEDISTDRYRHIIGRYEENASKYYDLMLKNAESYHEGIVLEMSKITRNILKAIDYERAIKKRDENYKTLLEELGTKNILISKAKGPYAFPFYHKDAQKIRRALIKDKIYIPCNWKNVIEDEEEGTIEYDFSSNILPLPVDQRYEREDILYMAERIKYAIKRLEE